MFAMASPNPFAAAQGFTIKVTGGTPPYTYAPGPTPPNPPGVTIDLGPPVLVTVPEDTPHWTPVLVFVTDSSEPAETVPAISVVG